MRSTPITFESLIEIGFEHSRLDDYTYHMNGNAIEVHENSIVSIFLSNDWYPTNATTMEDIQDLIRLFK